MQSDCTGWCLHTFIQQGRFVLLAIDNTDFNEDTTDGKRTTHATATVVYQQTFPCDEDRAFVLQPQDGQNKSLRQWFEPVIQECYIPASSKSNLQLKVDTTVDHDMSLIESHRQTDVSWLFARSFERNCSTSEKTPQESEPVTSMTNVDQRQTDIDETENENSVRELWFQRGPHSIQPWQMWNIKRNMVLLHCCMRLLINGQLWSPFSNKLSTSVAKLQALTALL